MPVVDGSLVEAGFEVAAADADVEGATPQFDAAGFLLRVRCFVVEGFREPGVCAGAACGFAVGGGVGCREMLG